MNHSKHLKIMREYHDSILAESSEASERDNPISIITTEETKLEIERAMMILPETDRKIIDLFFFEDKSYKQIAEEMVISKNSVGSQLNRAQRKIRKILDNKA